MNTIMNPSVSELTNNLISYLKNYEKTLKSSNKTNDVVPLYYSNWINGAGAWSRTQITIGEKQYVFDKKPGVQEREFLNILEDAIAVAGVRGRIETNDEYFVRLEIFTKPCKEFISLSKYIEKNAEFTLGDTEVYRVRVCGKRNNYSDTGDYRYLCYNSKKCSQILSDIRAHKTTRDSVSISVESYIDKGDESSYRSAMYHESEWYGQRGNKLCVIITTPSGKVKFSEKY